MTLPIAPVSSLKLIGVLISDLNVHKHLINFGNIFWHKFNKQTVTYLVKGCHWPRALADLLFCSYCQSSLLSCILSTFFPWLRMNPLHECGLPHLLHVLRCGISEGGFRGFVWIADLFWHCVLLHRLPPLILFVTVTIHMFERCLRSCPRSDFAFVDFFFSNITRVCCKDNSVKNHFIGFLNILSPEALGRSQTVPLFRTLLVLSWETSQRKILDCILVLHDSENRSKYVLSFFLSSSVPSPQVFSMSRLFFSTPYQQITAIFSLFLWRKWAIEHEFQVLSETLLAFW